MKANEIKDKLIVIMKERNDLEAKNISLKQQVDDLKETLVEIMDVASGEEQIEADGSYDDGDGMKWIFNRAEQALKDGE